MVSCPRSTASLVAIWLLAAAPAAAEEPPDDEVEAAVLAYEAGDYELASRRFGLLYDRYGLPHFLYAQAQAVRLRGDCPGAMVLYEKYIATEPPEENLVAARDAIARCREDASAESTSPGKKTEPEEKVETARPVVPAAGTRRRKPRRSHSPWYSDALGGTLTGVGLVAGGVGTFLVVSARRSLSRAPTESATLGDYRQRVEDDRRAERLGWGVAGAGAALVSLGIIRYLTRDDGQEAERSVAMTPGPDSLVLGVQGTF